MTNSLNQNQGDRYIIIIQLFFIFGVVWPALIFGGDFELNNILS